MLFRIVPFTFVNDPPRAIRPSLKRRASRTAPLTLADGTKAGLDPAFVPTASVSGAVRDALLLSEGRIAIGGSFTNVNGTILNNIARLTPGGTLDGTFDPGPGADNPVYALAESISDFQSKI